MTVRGFLGMCSVIVGTLLLTFGTLEAVFDASTGGLVAAGMGLVILTPIIFRSWAVNREFNRYDTPVPNFIVSFYTWLANVEFDECGCNSRVTSSYEKRTQEEKKVLVSKQEGKLVKYRSAVEEYVRCVSCGRRYFKYEIKPTIVAERWEDELPEEYEHEVIPDESAPTR